MFITKQLSDYVSFDDATFVKRVIFADDNLLSFVLNFKAGQSLPSHKHEESTLVLTVLSGSGTVRVNGQDSPLQVGVVVKADGPDDFAIPEVTEDLSVFVNIGPNPTDIRYAQDIG